MRSPATMCGRSARARRWTSRPTGGRWSSTGTVRRGRPTSGYPSARGSPGLAFDGKELVLFGGTPANSQTWYLVLNGANLCWQQLGLGAPTPLRTKFRMAFHPFNGGEPLNGEIQLFGGVPVSGPFPFLNDTWFFTPTNGWIACGTDPDHPCGTPPSRRCCVGLAFGNNLGGVPNGQMALFGGQIGPEQFSQSFNDETWLWDKTQGWHCVPNCPP